MSEATTVILLAVIQGLTEFLPVSSSGHLAVLSAFCGLKSDTGLSLGIVLHAGSLLAIAAFYFRLLLGFFLNLIDFGAAGLPRLRHFDVPLACGIGLLHGIFLVFVLFMLAPLMLVVVPRLSKFIDDSLLGGFAYRANLLLRMVPTL